MNRNVNFIRVILIISMIFILNSCKEEVNGWYVFEWGTNKNLIMSVLNDRQIDSTENGITIDDFSMFNHDFFVMLEFDLNSRLTKANMISKESPGVLMEKFWESGRISRSGLKTREEAYRYLSYQIVDKYGKPDNVEELQITDKLRTKTLIWYFKATTLELMDSELSLNLKFTPK